MNDGSDDIALYVLLVGQLEKERGQNFGKETGASKVQSFS